MGANSFSMENAGMASTGAASERAYGSARMGFANAGPTEESARDMIKFLKDFSSEYSDD